MSIVDFGNQCVPGISTDVAVEREKPHASNLLDHRIRGYRHTLLARRQK
jgi:hypothetical protein